MSQNEESVKWYVQVSVYILGIILGLGAKLAAMHKQKPVTIVQAVCELVVALAAAYFVWTVCIYYHQEKIAHPLSIIVGRYGDDMIRMGWRFLKSVIAEKV